MMAPETQRLFRTDPAPGAPDVALTRLLIDHSCCTWEQVGQCVWCFEHQQRLYRGQLPASRVPRRAR